MSPDYPPLIGSILPKQRKVVKTFPKKENLWLYVMAGQSNMAGRAKTLPQDTLSNNRIIFLGQDKKWFFAQEPLHFYEPKRAGLDCGKAFAEELLSTVPDSITIGLIPCAVGGSAINYWLSDTTYRGVKLISNFSNRITIAKKKGVLKGILWHQGESDTKDTLPVRYKKKLVKLLQKFRTIVDNDSLPIILGKLRYFGTSDHIEKSSRWQQINTAIESVASTYPNVDVLETKDFHHIGDSIHFDRTSQQLMGKRYARIWIEIDRKHSMPSLHP